MRIKNATPSRQVCTVFGRFEDGTHEAISDIDCRIGSQVWSGSVEEIRRYIDPTKSQREAIVAALNAREITLNDLGIGLMHGGYSELPGIETNPRNAGRKPKTEKRRRVGWSIYPATVAAVKAEAARTGQSHNDVAEAAILAGLEALKSRV
jgi:hypothetical protein